MSDVNKTPLYEKHIELGAKMTEFAGFSMPVQYEGIIKEHTHTRTKASLFDISHMGEFRLKGADAKKTLAGICTHNFNSFGPGACRYGFLLDHDGGVLDDLIIYCLDYDDYMLVVNAACIEQDFAWISDNIPDDMFFQDISEYTAKIDLQGPLSCIVLNHVMDNDWRFLKYFAFQKIDMDGDTLLISRTGYTGELGFELYGRNELLIDLWERFLEHPEVKPAGLGARDTLRLEMGYPLYGNELDAQHTPREAGLGFFLKSKADYIGKVPTLAEDERLIPLRLDGRRSAARGDEVADEAGNVVGRITSASFAPSLGYAIAFAYVQAAFAENERFLLKGRRADLTAVRSSLPFYTEGSARKQL